MLCSRMPGRPVQRGCSSGVCERMPVHPVCQRGRSPCVCSCIPVHQFVKCGCNQVFKKKKKKKNYLYVRRCSPGACKRVPEHLVMADATLVYQCIQWYGRSPGVQSHSTPSVFIRKKNKKMKKSNFQKILSMRHLFQSARCIRTHAGACSSTPRIVYGCGRACAESRNIRFLPFRDRRGRLSVRRPGAL